MSPDITKCSCMGAKRSPGWKPLVHMMEYHSPMFGLVFLFSATEAGWSPTSQVHTHPGPLYSLLRGLSPLEMPWRNTRDYAKRKSMHWKCFPLVTLKQHHGSLVLDLCSKSSGIVAFKFMCAEFLCGIAVPLDYPVLEFGTRSAHVKWRGWNSLVSISSKSSETLQVAPQCWHCSNI